MTIYFHLEATFRAYLAQITIFTDNDLFIFERCPKDVINIYTVPDFVSRDELNHWHNFQRVLLKAYIDDRICFLLDDKGQRIGQRLTLEQHYANSLQGSRYWYGKALGEV